MLLAAFSQIYSENQEQKGTKQKDLKNGSLARKGTEKNVRIWPRRVWLLKRSAPIQRSQRVESGKWEPGLPVTSEICKATAVIMGAEVEKCKFVSKVFQGNAASGRVPGKSTCPGLLKSHFSTSASKALHRHSCASSVVRSDGSPWGHPPDAGFAGMQNARVRGSWWPLLRCKRRFWEARQSSATALEFLGKSPMG